MMRNKARREEITKLKHKKRCKAMGLSPKEHYCYKAQGKPCSCFACSSEKFSRNTKQVKKTFNQEMQEYYVNDMTTLLKLKNELNPYKNTLVIGDFDNIVRLVDVIDGEEDYYWVYDTRKGIVHASCVGGWIALKGFISDEDYKRLINIWNLNNIIKAI